MKGHARDHTQFKCGTTGATEGFDDYPGYCGKCNAHLDLDLIDSHLEYLRMYERDRDELAIREEYISLARQGKIKPPNHFKRFKVFNMGEVRRLYKKIWDGKKKQYFWKMVREAPDLI